ncbi:acid protease [Auriculariales sp. MPI-PUGE-AT-0066]|nr:acid protease [Auriculariales sp. MPI-PUGE-AT-0066]
MVAIVLVALSFTLASSALPSYAPHDLTSTTSLRRAVHTSKKNRTSTWAHNQAANLRNKYRGGKSIERRQSSGSTSLINLNADSTFPFEVILDTGSSDMWLAGTSCPSCASVPRFDETASSTFSPTTTAFSIQYGSGNASGSLVSDVVQMSGFEIPNQSFAVVSQVSRGLLDNDISGLLGLGFSTIASSGAVPFAETLAEQNVLKQPLFSFFLTRFLDVLQTGDNIAQYGGEFTLGGTDSTLFTGDVEFVDIPAGREGFWGLEMSTLIVNGQEIPVPSTENFAAIDTGTTLVGGPSDLIAAIYSQVTGAVRGATVDPDLEGFWVYPCSSPIVISLAFGAKGQNSQWTVDPRDMELMRLSARLCVGAFFEIDLGPSSENPAWIVGDTFLKSVYSVYRFDPPSVGFAKLSPVALARNGVIDQQLPTATSVSNPTRATASGVPSGGRLTKDRGNDAPRTVMSWTAVVVSALVVGFGVM